MKVQRIGLILGSAAVVALLASLASVQAGEEKTPTTKEIMKKLADKEAGIVAKAAKLGKDEKWDDAAKLSKDIKEYGAALGKNKPKKGDTDSWEKLTKKYADTTAEIATAVGKKDAKALETSVKAFSGMCKSCHEVHK